MRVHLPERVWFELFPASYGSRALAYSLDFLLRWSTIAVLFLLFLFWDLSVTLLLEFSEASKASKGYLLAITIVGVFILEWGYPIFFDLFFCGVSPGKKIVGLRVVDESGLPVTFRASLIRNIFLLIDMLPMLGLVGLVSIVATRRSQRLGDLAGKTMVIFDDNLVSYPESVTTKSDQGIKYSLPPKLYWLIEQFFLRRGLVDGPLRESLSQELLNLAMQACRLEKVIAQTSGRESEVTLQALFLRAAPTEVSLKDGSGSVGEGGPEANRIKAPQLDFHLGLNYKCWGDYHQELLQLDSEISRLAGNHSLSEEAVERSISSYEQICQRYIFLSSFASGLSFAERARSIVQRSRYLVYGRRLPRFMQEEGRFIDRAKAGFRRALPHVSISAILFLLGVFVSFFAVKLNSELGWHYLSDQVVADLRAGRLWTDQIRGLEAVTSSQILTNNIAVSLLVFALGITGGIGTVLVLVQNGVMLGGIFAALANYQMASPLAEFVVAHGFLEISVIVVSGGCGLLIADSLLHPGDSRRLVSLQKQMRQIVDLVFLNALALIVAGIVEGHISPNPAIAYEVKLGLGLCLGISYWFILAKK